MSFEAAIGQVDQIFQWQQQIADPAAASGGGDSSSATSSTDTASTDADFAAALAEAQGSSADLATGASGNDSTEDSDLGVSDTDSTSLLSGGDSQLLSLLSSLGTTDPSSDGELDELESALETGTTATTGTQATGLSSDEGGTSLADLDGGGADLGQATSADDPRITAMVDEANSLIGEPYVWGGGHDGWGEQSGYDCSGFVSAVLHAGGYLTSPQDTTTLPSAAGIEQGPGQYVTIYDRTDEGSGQDHVIIDIGGQFYESGGEAGSWGGGGGVEKIGTPSAAYLSTFNDILHPAGL